MPLRSGGSLVTRDEPLAIWEDVSASQADELLVTFDVPLANKISVEESLQFIGKQGYQRILDPTVKPRRGNLPEVLRVDEAAKRLVKRKLTALSVVQDRVRLAKRNRARFLEAVEQAINSAKAIDGLLGRDWHTAVQPPISLRCVRS